MEKNSIPIEVLLSYPYFWSPATTNNFFLKVYKFLTDKKATEKKARIHENNGSVTKFMENLNAEAEKQKIVGLTGCWGTVLENKGYYELLVTKYAFNGPAQQCYNTNFITDLLKLIRNKDQHFRDIPMEVKEQLGWYPIPADKFEVQVFVEFWTEQFPQLLPFLWLKLYKFKDHLSEFYPVPLDLKNSPLTLAELLEKLDETLHYGLMRGDQDVRYLACDMETPSFEIQSRPLQQVKRIFPEDLTVVIAWTGNRLIFRKGVVSTEINCSGADVNLEPLALVVCKSTGNIELDILRMCRNVNRIVMISNLDKIVEQKIVANIESAFENKYVVSPLEWKEIDLSYQNKIENTQVSFAQQENLVHIKQIFKSETDRNNLLQGDLLKRLLRKEKVELFQKQKMEFASDLYIERNIIDCDHVSAQILTDDTTESDRTHVFVVTKMETGELKRLLEGIDFVTVDDLRSFEADVKENFVRYLKCKIFLLQNQHTSLADVLAAFKQFDLYSNVHLLEYMGNKQFKCVSTKGNYSSSAKLFAKYGIKISESEILSRKLSNVDKTNVFLIFDEPGSGKSEFSKHLACSLQNKHKTRIVVSLTMKAFVQALVLEYKKSEIDAVKSATKQKVEEALTKLLCCTETEKALVHHWLNTETSNEIFFEMVLDSLDELSQDMFPVGVEVINTLSKQFQSVRVFATAREYLMGKFATNFAIFGHRLAPFSPKTQARFMLKRWQNLDKNIEATAELKAFAEKCVNICVSGESGSMSKTPLVCQMIADVMFHNAQSGKLDEALHQFDEVDLYEKLFEQLFGIYFRKKNLHKLDKPLVNVYVTNMYKTLTYYALALVLHPHSDPHADLFGKEKTLKILSSDLGSSEEMDIAVLEQGLVKSVKPIKFIHFTFAEYAVARFFYKVLSEGCYLGVRKDDQGFLEDFRSVLFQISLESRKTECKLAFSFPGICQFFTKFWKKNHGSKSKLPDFYVNLAFNMQPKFMTPSEMLMSEITSYTGYKPDLFLCTLEFLQYNIFNELVQNEQFIGKGFLTAKLRKHDIFSEILVKLNRWPNQFVNDNFQYQEFEQLAVYFADNYPEKYNRKKLFNCFANVGLGISPLVFRYIHDFLVGHQQASLYLPDEYGNSVIHGRVQWTEGPMDELENCLRNYIWILIQAMQQVNCPGFIDMVDSKGDTPLTSVIKILNFQNQEYPKECVKLWEHLLSKFKEYNADFNSTSKTFRRDLLENPGMQPLHHAISKDFPARVVEKLIKCGANVHAVDSWGWTPLHYAVRVGSEDVIKLLVAKYKVDTRVKNIEGKMPFEVQKISTRVYNPRDLFTGKARKLLADSMENKNSNFKIALL